MATSYFDFLRKKIRLVLGLSLIGVVLGVGFSYIKPREWRVRAAIILPIEDKPKGLASFLGGEATSVEYYLGILDSYPAKSELAKVAKMDMEDVEKQYTLSASPVESQVRIAIRHEDKRVALKMAQVALDHLKVTVDSTIASIASTEAQYLQQAVSEREQDLAFAEKKLLEFTRSAKTSLSPDNPMSVVGAIARQREIGILLARKEAEIKTYKQQAQRRAAPSASIPLGIPEIEEWRRKTEALEYELNMKRISMGDEAPQVIALKKSLDLTRKSLQSAVQKYLTATEQSLSVDLAKLVAEKQVLAWEYESLKSIVASAPSEATQFSALTRNVKIITESILALRVQLEAALVKAKVERARWSVLTPPYVEDKPISRGTAMNAILSGVLGMCLAMLIVYVQFSKKGT